MSIGSIGGGGSAYSIGGRPLGVQLGGKSATELIGGGGGQVENLFAINVASSAASGPQVQEQDLVLKGLQDEIDRTQGYRTNLSVAEKQELADLQGEIQEFNEVAQSRSLSSDEIQDRAELYTEAYKILGKDYVDLSQDEFLKGKVEELEELMAPILNEAEQKRLDVLTKMQENMQDRVDALGESGAEIYYDQMRNISRFIQEIETPRDITELSPEELRQHDEIADAINEYAGTEMQITSDKRLKIARLQRTMELVQQGGVNTII